VTRASDAIKAPATRDTGHAGQDRDIGWSFNAQFYGSLYDRLTKKRRMRKAALSGIEFRVFDLLSRQGRAGDADRGVQVGVPVGAAPESFRGRGRNARPRSRAA
jgi:hypothetical protein